MSEDVNILALSKGVHRYIFVYSDDRKKELLRQFGKFASNEELNFTWYDAAVLAKKVREVQEKYGY